MRRAIIVVTIAVLALILCVFFGPRFAFRLHAIRTAETHQQVAQAICDFRSQHGLLPEDLKDIVPTYLPNLPANSRVFWSSGYLTIRTGWGTDVWYSFRSEREGWYVEGGELPVPKVTPSRPPVTGDDLIQATLAEYDRRISRSPTNLWHRTLKISFLLKVERTDDAYAECKAAASAHPDWWRPQMALAVLAPPRDAAEALERFRDWVEDHPAFIHYWYLSRYYRDVARPNDALAALAEGVKFPLKQVDDDARWVPNAFAFDAATFACQEQRPELVLAITDMWSSPQGVHQNPGDDLYAFRAAANLALGRTSEARADADLVIAASRQHKFWAGNLDQLDSAITEGDQSFIYDPGEPHKGFFNWTLFPEPEWQR